MAVAPAPQDRVHAPGGDRPVRRDGRHVLYWMTSARRTAHAWGLQHAVARAAELGRPLVVLEALRLGYEHASPRLHRFVVQGMADNRAALQDTPVAYHPYVEPAPEAGKGLLAALAEDACLVVTDHFPHGFLPRMLEAALRRVPARFEVVDGNGIVPLAATPGPFTTARSFRAWIQKRLPDLLDAPEPDPVAAADDAGALPEARVPEAVASRWPASHDLLDDPDGVAALPLEHDVPFAPLAGGSDAGARLLADFIPRIPAYPERNHPDAEAQSGLSPYLHFGHVGAHQVARAVLDAEGWTPDRLAPPLGGKRVGWWGVSEAAEGFLDQLVTWRELGFVELHHRPDATGFASLPDFARATLDAHRGDSRPTTYPLEQLEQARTHDAVWNAAQTQLLREGVLQNYLRMLWGKKILEWSPDPETALKRMFHLNDRYALDGRDPNSVNGILWCLGRYDRGWGPERPVYGTVRYMTSDSARRKLRMTAYLHRYAEDDGADA